MKNNLLILLVTLLFIGCKTPEPATSTTTTKEGYTNARNASAKTLESYREAYKMLQQKEYNKADKALENLIKKDPTFVNSYLVLSDLKIKIKDTTQAIANLKKAIEIAPDYDPRAYLSLANIAMQQEDYKEAEKQATKSLEYPKMNQKLRDKAAKIKLDAEFRPQALANPVPFEPINLGENINSNHRDYFPSLTLKNDLVYTVQIGEGQRGQEDLYISKKVDDKWQKSKPIETVNTSDNEGAQSISADGNLLVFTVCNQAGDLGSCDLYYSRRINNRWTKPLNMGPPINTPNWESQPSIAPNSDGLYFVRGGARGTGSKDLYFSSIQEDGRWGTPQKIDELNTPYNESSPSIHPDGNTLYFSSDGHAGMGGFDLFVSRRQADGKWGEPQNLGYPINTPAAEEALAVSLKGDVAYLASNRTGGFGSLDIYSFTLPEAARPTPVTYIQGITRNAVTNDPLSAYVEIIDLKTQKRFTKLTTKKDGEFMVCLPVGEYALNARRPQYAFFSANYNLSETVSLDEAYQLVALLQPLQAANPEKPNLPIVLENVFFNTASAELLPTSKAELDKLKEFLAENKTTKIQLNGHTDNVGKPADNLDLSQRRADAVRQYLIERGVAADRMTTKGFGETKPIQPNDTAANRAKNRRTEFQIL